MPLLPGAGISTMTEGSCASRCVRISFEDRPRRAREVVDHGDRGDRDGDADGGRDERLADRAHDLIRSARSRRGMAERIECTDDADDGSEEPDERRVVAERREDAEAA